MSDPASDLEALPEEAAERLARARAARDEAAERLRLALQALDDARRWRLVCIDRQERNLQAIDALVGQVRELAVHSPCQRTEELLAEALALRAEAAASLPLIGHA